MGLDMYLQKRHYVKIWAHQKPGERSAVTVTLGGKPHPSIKSERVSYVIEEVAYWRKANAIHRWFVEHVQNGEDDCGDYYVGREQLQELRDECDKVLAASPMTEAAVHVSTVSEGGGPWKKVYEPGEAIADVKVAKAVLPTQSGFFFGHQDYDQYYVEKLRYTSKVLGELLAESEAEDDFGDFYYSSSW